MSKLGVLMWRHIFNLGDNKRLAKQAKNQDTSDLQLIKNIAYIQDGERGHLLDIYQKRNLGPTAPVVINIHGGGLFSGYKEVTANFNYK